MKKFVFLYYGYVPFSEEIVDAWGKWFDSIGEYIVDSGNPFGAGREITQAGTTELSFGPESIMGYTVINAESLDEAVEIARGCPFTTGIRVYEAVSM